MSNSRSSFSIETKVNKGDIARGNKDEPESCPVARSLKRGIKNRFRRWGEPKVAVGANHVFSINEFETGRKG